MKEEIPTLPIKQTKRWLVARVELDKQVQEYIILGTLEPSIVYDSALL